MIWEFRAEGTGYPDEAVGGRVWHFPWPDHHPPPFVLLPRIMASMRDWLKPPEIQEGAGERKDASSGGSKNTSSSGSGSKDTSISESKPTSSRVVVVHCKAGKGRSGTASCSYLISEEGWTKEDAVQRFTERRMRPGWGAGVSIPSQLRWLGYVERWKNGGKLYVERKVEVTEVHVWGLNAGVQVSVRGFIEEGKVIKNWHTFTSDEREIVRGEVGNYGISDAVWEIMGTNKTPSEPNSKTGTPKVRSAENLGKKGSRPSSMISTGSTPSTIDGGTTTAKQHTGNGPSKLSDEVPTDGAYDSSTAAADSSEELTTGHIPTTEPVKIVNTVNGNTAAKASPVTPTIPATTTAATTTTPTKSTTTTTAVITPATTSSGADAIFRPKNPIILASNDINIDTERRTKGSLTFGVTTHIAHVWFNTFFEGNGPENGGHADTSGVFEIEWDKMDGIKGSSKRGLTKAFEKIQVVWKVADGDEGSVVRQPGVGEEVRQAEPADWKGAKANLKPDNDAVEPETSDEEDQGTKAFVHDKAGVGK
jgi:protein-tyrosine phosphatase